MTQNNMQLWDAVRTPNPVATKAFTRGGGFKGTATNAVYLIQRATELWGPMGGAWGVEIIDDRVIDGAPMIGKDGSVIGHERVHVIRINLRHPAGIVPGYGQTMLVGTNKNGPYTDEEAPKKSLTDALTKALSWLGFAADIHMGLWDDNKYVAEVRRAYAEAPSLPTEPPAPLATTGMDASRLADWLESIHAAAANELKDVATSAQAAARTAGDAPALKRIQDAILARKAAFNQQVAATQ